MNVFVVCLFFVIPAVKKEALLKLNYIEFLVLP